MIRLKFLMSVFLMLPYLSIAQDSLRVSGMITDCKSGQPIEMAEVRLDCQDGSVYKALSDTTGNYEIKGPLLKNELECVLSVMATSKTRSSQHSQRVSYLSSSDKRKFCLRETGHFRQQENVCLTRILRCYSQFPEFIFQKNSAEKYSLADSTFDMGFLFYFLEDNTSVSIEIAGHASEDEKNPMALSKARAEMVRNMLVKRGVDPGRLTVAVKASKQPAQRFDEYGNEMKLEPAEKRRMSRRVTTLIMRRDYKKE